MATGTLGPTQRRFVFLAANALVYLRHPFLIARFRKKVGYFPDVAHPRLYHELVFWRKVFDRNPVLAIFCDKLATKDYLKKNAPGLKVAETLWIGERLDDEAHALLDRGCVLKANHGSNFNYIPARGRLDRAAVDRLARKWMRRRYQWRNYEYLYTAARRTLFIEEFLQQDGAETVEIQVRAADGRAILLSTITDQKTGRDRVAYFGLDGIRRRDVESKGMVYADDDFAIPPSYREAIRHSKALSRDLDYARFDFFDIGGTLYGGEITVYPSAGLGARNPTPDGLDRIIADNWKLRASPFFRAQHGPLRALYARALMEALDAEGR